MWEGLEWIVTLRHVAFATESGQRREGSRGRTCLVEGEGGAKGGRRAGEGRAGRGGLGYKSPPSGVATAPDCACQLTRLRDLASGNGGSELAGTVLPLAGSRGEYQHRQTIFTAPATNGGRFKASVSIAAWHLVGGESYLRPSYFPNHAHTPTATWIPRPTRISRPQGNAPPLLALSRLCFGLHSRLRAVPPPHSRKHTSARDLFLLAPPFSPSFSPLLLSRLYTTPNHHAPPSRPPRPPASCPHIHTPAHAALVTSPGWGHHSRPNTPAPQMCLSADPPPALHARPAGFLTAARADERERQGRGGRGLQGERHTTTIIGRVTLAHSLVPRCHSSVSSSTQCQVSSFSLGAAVRYFLGAFAGFSLLASEREVFLTSCLHGSRSGGVAPASRPGEQRSHTRTPTPALSTLNSQARPAWRDPPATRDAAPRSHFVNASSVSLSDPKILISSHYQGIAYLRPLHRVLPGRACTLRCPQGVLASVRALSIYEVPPRQQERIAMPSDLLPLTVLPCRCTHCRESSRRERGKERSQQERIVAPEDRQRKHEREVVPASSLGVSGRFSFLRLFPAFLSLSQESSPPPVLLASTSFPCCYLSSAPFLPSRFLHFTSTRTFSFLFVRAPFPKRTVLFMSLSLSLFPFASMPLVLFPFFPLFPLLFLPSF
ncbi:hypothetical protein C7M84_009905 [Penaeus vannamei]|uniref:Uncharacterized protein n=1 Tax=Penaeus vannamei TaxID=6689 RepID=A0A423T5I3_PENVA|nr:hypothetical protein C7M84_009905 [Penaeus vannamei]